MDSDTPEPPDFALQPGESWEHLLISSEAGPRALVANAITALRHAPEWRNTLRYDEFAERLTIVGQPPIKAINGHWTDTDDVLAAAWLQHQGIHVKPDVAAQAAETVARQNPIHPITDYLDGLKWDGRERIDTWLTYYMGVADTPYARAVGRRWLISAVARVRKPGCKADHCLILEGPQGRLKSTALQTLADPWFTDDLADLGSKDAAMQTAGVWIIEMAELDSLGRADAKRAKAFLARRVDRFRPPYGRRLIDRKRQCIFAGTTNLSQYLQDETGGRRFWPVEIHTIDLDGIAADRSQLWAEADHAYKAGDPWWLENEELRLGAVEQQSAREIDDPWDGRIAEIVSGKSRVTIADVLTDIGFMNKELDQRSQNRAAKCLIKMGWKRFRYRDGSKLVWGYAPPEPAMEQTDLL